MIGRVLVKTYKNIIVHLYTLYIEYHGTLIYNLTIETNKTSTAHQGGKVKRLKGYERIFRAEFGRYYSLGR